MSNFVSHGQGSVCSVNDLVRIRLASSLAHWALPSKNETLLAQKENLLIQDNGTALFQALIR